MSFETHIFSSAKEACSYIACRSPSGDNPFASVSLVVPTQALKHRIMQTMSSLSVHVFSINEYVHDIIYSANKHPFFESPIFSILIRNVIDALSREGFTSIQELEKTLDQFEHGYEGLVDSVRALLAAELALQTFGKRRDRWVVHVTLQRVRDA